MGTSFTQDKRLYRIATTLGENALIPESIYGVEAMSDDFHYVVEAFSESHHDLEPKDLVGKAVTLVVIQEDGSEDYTNGYVQSLEALGRSWAGQRSSYQLTISSGLAFLEKRADCRVFQNKSIPEVIKEILAPLTSQGLVGADLSRISGAHPKQRFLVQYNETDYNLLCRLGRREGIAFFITHENGSHTVNFIDKGMLAPPLDPSELELNSGNVSHDHLYAWQHHGQFVSGAYAQSTYNYNESDAPLRKDVKAKGPAKDLPRAKEMEQYFYSEGYHNLSEAQGYASARMQEGVERHQVVFGAGTYRCLKPGFQFKVRQVPDGQWRDKGSPFMFTRVSMRMDDMANTAMPCVTEFEAVPRGELVFPQGEQPEINSLQTAVVTGRQKGTVYTDHGQDKLGRIKVLFHWDRAGKADENSSCWLRVMQNGSGAGVSAFYALPRVGDEVVVAFENGNPDRPFVLGALPNLRNKPPYGKEPTRSGIKTQSFTPGSGPARDRWNELRFDDKANSEEVYLRAQKDLNCDVENDATTNVKNNATLNVKNNRTTVIEGEEKKDVTKSLSVMAGTEISLTVGANSIVIDKEGISVTGGKITINGSPVSIN